MRKAIVGVICLCLAACVQTTTNLDAQPEYGVIVVGQPDYFGHVKTFSWHPIAVKAFLEGRNSGKQAISIYKNEIENQMVRKGYELIDSSASDVVVSFGLAQQSELSDESLYKGTALSTGVDTFYYDNKEAEKGSVYIVFYGRNLDVPDWKALAQGGMSSGLSSDEKKQRAAQVVSMMLRKIPQAM